MATGLFGVRSAEKSTAIGKHTIWVPATAMLPMADNGCAPLTISNIGGVNAPDLQSLNFDASADEHAQFVVAFPTSWNRKTITFRGFWTTGAAVTTGVALALQAAAVSEGDTLAATYGTAVVVTDDANGTGNDLFVTAESDPVTIAGTPADADLVNFRVFRDVSDANDDMTQDMELLGLQIFYNTDAAVDE